MKGLSLFGVITFSIMGTAYMAVALLAKEWPYACLSGICYGVFYVAYTDYRKAREDENIFIK